MGTEEKNTLDHVEVDMLSTKIISKVRITNIKECFSLISEGKVSITRYNWFST